MITLGIDQSMTCTGIWVTGSGEYVHHELIKTSKIEGDALQNFKRVISIKNRIAETIRAYDIEAVVIEGLGFGASGDATRTLAGLQFAIVNMIIEQFPSITIDIVAPTSLKKVAVGKGNASKDEMLEGCPDHVKEIADNYPKSSGKYDLVDAYFLSVYKQK